MQNDLQKQIDSLTLQLKELRDGYYANNFTGSQDFNKFSRFNSRLKVPSYSVVPTVCEVGEVIEVAGKLRICSAPNVYTIVGTQT